MRNVLLTYKNVECRDCGSLEKDINSSEKQWSKTGKGYVLDTIMCAQCGYIFYSEDPYYRLVDLEYTMARAKDSNK